MAERIRVYGRVDGKVQFQYGPKKFDADWGGAFTALEILNLLSKLRKVPIGGRTPIVIRKVGGAVQKQSLLSWLGRFDSVLVTLGLDSLAISATNVRWYWTDAVLPSQLVTFAGTEKPSLLIAEALLKMGLRKWGVVKALTVALSEFDSRSRPEGAKLSVSVFITT